MKTLADLINEHEPRCVEKQTEPRIYICHPQFGRLMAMCNRHDIFILRRPGNLVTLSPFRSKEILLADVTVDRAMQYLAQVYDAGSGLP